MGMVPTETVEPAFCVGGGANGSYMSRFNILSLMVYGPLLLCSFFFFFTLNGGLKIPPCSFTKTISEQS